MENATGCLKARILWVAVYPALHLNNKKQIIQIKHDRINCQEETSGLFTSMSDDLNSGQLRTNPANGQSGTQDHQIASLTNWPLGHTNSSCFETYSSRLYHSLVKEMIQNTVQPRTQKQIKCCQMLQLLLKLPTILTSCLLQNTRQQNKLMTVPCN